MAERGTMMDRLSSWRAFLYGPFTFIVLDNDDYSSSNVSSVVLTQPAGGWKAPVEEIEYLCFYDATSWPIHKQKTGKLPVGCDVK